MDLRCGLEEGLSKPHRLSRHRRYVGAEPGTVQRRVANRTGELPRVSEQDDPERPRRRVHAPLWCAQPWTGSRMERGPHNAREAQAPSHSEGPKPDAPFLT